VLRQGETTNCSQRTELPVLRRSWIGAPNLHLQEIRLVMIPNPPLAPQRDFACRITALERIKAAYRTSLAELKAHFDSLRHRAFRGEL
jgi:type I restriction enzyme S subunit